MYTVPTCQLLPSRLWPCIPMYTSTKLIWLALNSYDTWMPIIKKYMFLKIYSVAEKFNSFNDTFMTDSKSTLFSMVQPLVYFIILQLCYFQICKTWTFSTPWEWYAIGSYTIGQWYNLSVMMAGHNAYLWEDLIACSEFALHTSSESTIDFLLSQQDNTAWWVNLLRYTIVLVTENNNTIENNVSMVVVHIFDKCC